MVVADINGTALVVGDAVVIQYGRVQEVFDDDGTVSLVGPSGHSITVTGNRVEKHAVSIATSIAAILSGATSAILAIDTAYSEV